MDERDQQAVDELPRGAVSSADPRRLYAVIVVLLAIIVLLAIRPWGDDARAPGPPPAGLASTGRDTLPPGEPDPSIMTPPTPVAGSAAGMMETCGTPSGWRAATLQDWAGRDTPIRSWIAVEPVEATSPQDPAIPFVPVATGIVTAIGYCAPLDEASRPPTVARASLWAIGTGRQTPLSLIPLEPDTPDPMGGLWSRPGEITGGGAGSGVWPPGRYVVELASPGGEYRRWLGIEIADLALLRASPSAPVPVPSDVPAGPASPEASSVAPAP